MSLLGCHLPSMPWDVGQMGATTGTESTCYNLLLWWVGHLSPPLKMLQPLSRYQSLHFTPEVATHRTWEGIFCFAHLVHCCLPNYLNNHVVLWKVVPWQHTHQNPLDIVCKWAWHHLFFSEGASLVSHWTEGSHRYCLKALWCSLLHWNSSVYESVG